MKKIYQQFWVIGIVIFLSAAQVSAASLAINEFRLANGVKVLHVERQNIPIVTMSMLVKASPRDEEPRLAGLAYLTAKLLTDGTVTKKGPEISEAIEYLGASLGTSIAPDFTVLSFSSLKKDASAGLALVSDVVMNPVFAEDELVRRKAVTKGALRQREEDPQYVANRRFLREVFGPNHPYGRVIEGTPGTLDAISRADVVGFYGRYYRPDNTVIAVVGDLTAAEARRMMEHYFGTWSVRAVPSSAGAVEQVPQPTAKRVVINRDVTQASIVFGHAGIARNNPDYYAVQVMNYILGGGGFASRLMQVVRDEMGLAYSIYSSFSAQQETGSFSVEVQTKNVSASTVVKEIEGQIQKIRTKPVLDAELRDAKAYLTGSFPRRLETSKKIVDLIIGAEFFGLGADYVQKYPSYIKQVSKEDVLRVAQKYLHADHAALVIVGKEAEMKLPDVKSKE